MNCDRRHNVSPFIPRSWLSLRYTYFSMGSWASCDGTRPVERGTE
jgi:hypothetical protein